MANCPDDPLGFIYQWNALCVFGDLHLWLGTPIIADAYIGVMAIADRCVNVVPDVGFEPAWVRLVDEFEWLHEVMAVKLTRWAEWRELWLEVPEKHHHVGAWQKRLIPGYLAVAIGTSTEHLRAATILGNGRIHVADIKLGPEENNLCVVPSTRGTNHRGIYRHNVLCSILYRHILQHMYVTIKTQKVAL